MFEKNLRYGTLLDYYGAILPERQRDALELYYNDDLSLAEIADEMGISRQGVRDAIKRGEAELVELESALGIYKTQAQMKSEADSIVSELCDIASRIGGTDAERITSIAEKIKKAAEA